MVQMAGIEPAREYKSRRILSPVRLPVSPHLQVIWLTDISYYTLLYLICQYKNSRNFPIFAKKFKKSILNRLFSLKKIWIFTFFMIFFSIFYKTPNNYFYFLHIFSFLFLIFSFYDNSNRPMSFS